MLAVGAIASAVVLFAASRMGGPEVPTLATLEQMSTPFEVALSNNKPTVIEFYANWWVTDAAACMPHALWLSAACAMSNDRHQAEHQL